MQIGCCAPPEQADLLAMAGYAYIEPAIAALMARPEAKRAVAVAALRAAPLPVDAFNVLFSGGYRIVGPEVGAGPGLLAMPTYVAQALDMVAEAGGKIVVFGSGGARRVPDGFDRQVAEQQLVDFLRLLGDAAVQRHVRIVIEPLNRMETNSMTSVAEATRLAQTVAHPAVGVLADMYHMVKDREPLDEVAVAGDLLWHAHISAIDRSAPVKDGPALASFFRSLRSAGYDGRVSIECRWEDLAAQAAPALEYVRRHVE